MIRLVLPYPPTLNTYWRTFKGRMLLSAKGRAYRTLVALEVITKGTEWLGIEKLAVLLVVEPPDHRQRDIDNLPKAILDSLAHARVYSDDSQIDALLVVRRGVVKDGRLTVCIWPIVCLNSMEVALNQMTAIATGALA